MEGTNNLSSFTSNPFVVILCRILVAVLLSIWVLV